MRFAICVAIFLSAAPTNAFAEEITETDLRGHIEILASDDFGGRKPGTEGENKTVHYIATEWRKAGLQPAAQDASWYAPVTLVDRTPLQQSANFTRFNGKRKKAIGIDDAEILLRGAVPMSTITDAAIIHAGYAAGSAEEFEKILSGKLVMMFLSSPPNAKGFPGYRERKANVIAAGAKGVLTVIRSESRFERSARRFRRVHTSLDGDGRHAVLEGIIGGEAADKLLRKAGTDFKQLSEDAKLQDFRPRAIGVYADLSAETRVRRYQSHNVIGKISGSKPESGALMFLGHWDHLGECRREPDVDRICNGAVDNASGISLLIEAAKRLVGDRPDRDIYFLATTAEESGLLGARAFAADPSFALDRLVAVFNVDTVALAPEGKLIAVVGRGKTDLDGDLEQVAAAENREIDKSDKANDFLKRQDGYAFLEKDIPAFMITSAFADQERLDSYLADRYHDVGDELDDMLLLGGAADDANFHVALGRHFGSVDSYPAKSGANYAMESVADGTANSTGE